MFAFSQSPSDLVSVDEEHERKAAHKKLGNELEQSQRDDDLDF